jgi:Rad51
VQLDVKELAMMRNEDGSFPPLPLSVQQLQQIRNEDTNGTAMMYSFNGQCRSGQSFEPQEPTTAFSMLQEQRRRHSLCLLQQPNLSLETGITQLAGLAGSGKTQMALTLCVSCVLGGKKAVYVSLGSSNQGIGLTKTSLRLRTMFAANASYKYSPISPHDQKTDDMMMYQLLSHVWLHGIRNSDDLMELLEDKLPRLLRLDPNISLVVLDSLASLFRVNEEIGNNNYNGHENLKSFGNHHHYHNDKNRNDTPWKNRATAFFKIATHCKSISDKYQLPFVIVNDATTKIEPSSPWNYRVVSSSQEPALGLSWSQCVNASYFVARLTERGATPATFQTQSPMSQTDAQPQQARTIIRRALRCLRSPKLASDTTILFQIDDRGAVPIAPF